MSLFLVLSLFLSFVSPLSLSFASFHLAAVLPSLPDEDVASNVNEFTYLSLSLYARLALSKLPSCVYISKSPSLI